MRQERTIEPSRSGALTRRQMMTALAAVGVLTSSFTPVLAAAKKVAKEADKTMVAAIFFESYSTVALRRALRYAGDNGFVASLPQLLHARVNASYDNIIWNTWFTTNSERRRKGFLQMRWPSIRSA